jgi:anti-sigma regulatory factor (Ser/Thr protein kinase)/anti-anti-sigma regulatory factor
MKATRRASEFDDRIILLELEEELAIEDCQGISAIFQQIIDSGKYYVIMIMEKITMISSPFLGKLMGCKLRLKERDGNLVIVGLGYEQKEKLFSMGANKVFQFYSDINSAYNYYQWAHKKTEQLLKLSMPPNLQAVPAVRRFLSSIAAQKGYVNKDAFRIETIVYEIANNAIEHGDSEQNEINMEYRINKDQVQLQVRNKTCPENTANLESLLNSSQEFNVGDDYRGRGLALVKLICNGIDASYDDTSTIINVTKMREE